MRQTLLVPFILLAACASPGGGPYPSLQPRAAEEIDPRIQPVRPMNERPVGPALAGQLASLVEQARAGDQAFAPAAATAERLAASAGAPRSEGWIQAQQALSAAIAARRLTTTAQADIDAIGARMLQAQGGLAPADLAAIENARDEAGAIGNRQAQRISAIEARLAR